MKKKIMIIQRIFTYYRKGIFDYLSKKYNLIVVHSKNKSGIKQVKTNYSKLVSSIKLSKKETNVFLNVAPSIIKYNPEIIIHEFSIGIISLFIVLILKRILNFKLILWSHCYNRRIGFDPKKNFTDKIRLFFIKHADSILIYTENDKKFFNNYITENKIYTANNTLDTKKLSVIKSKLKKQDLSVLKRKIGFKHKYNIIFLGRLLKSKRPELLIDIYNILKSKLNNDIGFHIIGYGPMYKVLKKKIENTDYENNFFLHGAIFEYEKNSIYIYCSDLLLLPGELGLSVIHSFCFEKPVFSFKKGVKGPYHGPEINYVKHGKTGFLAENNNINKLSMFIYKYLINKKLQESIKENINNLIKNECSLKIMLKNIDNCIDQVSNNHF